jgi:hypothetical protein
MAERFDMQSVPLERAGAAEEKKVFGSGGRILKAGDGLMKDAIAEFLPNGTFHFRALVKTEHTHSRDIWHIYVILKDANGNTIMEGDGLGNSVSNLPLAVSFKPPWAASPTTAVNWFDGPGMLQGQDYQTWDFTYQYPPAWYARLANITIIGDC